jgi:hypothetical protein
MAKSSIPNSTPANGRISTLSLLRSRRQKPEDLSGTQQRRNRIQEANAGEDRRRASSSARSRVFNSCFPAFLRDISSSRRVKGAWWPSRSSKSLSVPNDRGRFDSYPLRLISLRRAGTQVRGINHSLGRQSVFVRQCARETPNDAFLSEKSRRIHSRPTSSSFLRSCIPQRLEFPDWKGGDLDVA